MHVVPCRRSGWAQWRYCWQNNSHPMKMRHCSIKVNNYLLECPGSMLSKQGMCTLSCNTWTSFGLFVVVDLGINVCFDLVSRLHVAFTHFCCPAMWQVDQLQIRTRVHPSRKCIAWGHQHRGRPSMIDEVHTTRHYCPAPWSQTGPTVWWLPWGSNPPGSPSGGCARCPYGEHN